jgi:hypothetical protein
LKKVVNGSRWVAESAVLPSWSIGISAHYLDIIKWLMLDTLIHLDIVDIYNYNIPLWVSMGII